jgi:hypothetical protein
VLYPNPVVGELRFQAAGDLTGAQLQVFDLSGKLVLSVRNIANTLDVSRLHAGVYTIVIRNKGNVITRRFVKQ